MFLARRSRLCRLLEPLMKLRIAGLLGIVLVACAPKPVSKSCPDCTAGTVSISFPLSDSDVVRVNATITGAAISTPISQDLAIGGTPMTASGAISNIPAGTGDVITVTAYPADPESTVDIYSGQATVDIVG